ncbi:hypothetical protein HY407_04015 [Candidatus Gottesmanbacteria bacterium]|nr:hypothetical protein [Candidatus Gottesmanbacteria bacterium]
MDSGYTRTTITLPENLLIEIKKRALEKKKKMKDLIVEGLNIYINMDESDLARQQKNKSDITSLFGVWGKGPKGFTEVEEMRYGKEEKARETNLRKLWKKS